MTYLYVDEYLKINNMFTMLWEKSRIKVLLSPGKLLCEVVIWKICQVQMIILLTSVQESKRLVSQKYNDVGAVCYLCAFRD